jgi:hypothetical protein
MTKSKKLSKGTNKTIKHKKKSTRYNKKSKKPVHKKIQFFYIPKSTEKFDMDTYFIDAPELSELINKRYNSIEELIQYQKNIKKNKIWSEKENLWVDEYLQPIIDFFGDYDFIIQIFTVLRNDSDKYENIDDDNFIKGGRQIYFAGRGHWYANNGTTKGWIDPYEVGVQIKGTNQFCQTYAQMIMSGEIKFPTVYIHNDLNVYYEYTNQALLWQKKHLNLFHKSIPELLKTYNIKNNTLFTPNNEQKTIIDLINKFNDIYHKHDILMNMPYACLNVVNIETSLI